MKTIALLTLFLFYSLNVVAQIDLGSYSLVYLDREESILIINDIESNYISKFYVYSEDTSCVEMEISSKWNFANNKICFFEQTQKWRIDCNSEYYPIENIDSNCYDIIEKNDNYFIIQSDFNKDVKIKWTKR